MYSRYGFIADVNFKSRKNAGIELSNIPTWLYFCRPNNQSFHNLCKIKNPTPGMKNLLGLGLNFIPRPSYTSHQTSIDTNRFRRDAATKFFFAGRPISQSPKLFIRSNWQPDNDQLPGEFRSRLSDFENKLLSKFKKKKCNSNLLPLQRVSLLNIKNNNNYIVFKADKNLGPAIVERDIYIKKAFDEHLSNNLIYRELNQLQALNRVKTITLILNNFIKQFFTNKNSDKIYLERVIANVVDPFSYFYMLAKVHKSPWTTRPIVSVSGSLLYGLGKWLDVQLQKIVPYLPYTIKSSYELSCNLRNLKIPKNSQFFSMDAVSMYTNICTVHAIQTISFYLREKKFYFLDTEAVIKAITIIKSHNLFKFGDTYWLQLSGTAMGTPPAPTYATIYYAIHEMKLIPRHPNLYYYGRYIDDVIGIWTADSDPNKNVELFENFKKDTPYGKLTWEFTSLSSTINFLDVNFTLCKRNVENMVSPTETVTNVSRNVEKNVELFIETALFEKALNLYLYLPPHSCHAPGMIRGLISGTILRIQRLTSDQNKIIPTIKIFHQRLIARGYSKHTLNPIFQEFFTKNITPKNKKNINESLFLHLFFHPNDSPSYNIQEIFRNTMNPPKETPLHSLRNNNGSTFDHKCLTIAYHRHRNIGNILSSRKIDENGAAVSTIIRDDISGAINPIPNSISSPVSTHVCDKSTHGPVTIL